MPVKAITSANFDTTISKPGSIGIARSIFISDITNQRILPFNTAGRAISGGRRRITNIISDALKGNVGKLYSARKASQSTTELKSFNVDGNARVSAGQTSVETIPNFQVEGLFLDGTNLGIVGNVTTEDSYLDSPTVSDAFSFTHNSNADYFEGLTNKDGKIYALHSRSDRARAIIPITISGTKETDITLSPALTTNGHYSIAYDDTNFLLTESQNNSTNILKYNTSGAKQGNNIQLQSSITLATGLTKMNNHIYVLDGRTTIYIHDADLRDVSDPDDITIPSKNYNSICNDGRYLWILNQTDNRMDCIDPTIAGNNKRVSSRDISIGAPRSGFVWTGSTIIGDTMYLCEVSATNNVSYFKKTKIKEIATKQVYKDTITAEPSSKWITIPDTDGGARGLALDDTTQYILDESAQKVFKIVNGTQTELTNLSSDGGFSNNGMTLNDQDHLVVVNYGSNNRAKFIDTRNGNIDARYRLNSANTDVEAVGFDQIRKQYYIVDSGDDAIFIYNENFRYQGYVNLHSSNGLPKGVAVDDNYIFVNQHSDSQIYAYEISTINLTNHTITRRTNREFNLTQHVNTSISGAYYHNNYYYSLHHKLSTTPTGYIIPYKISYQGGEQPDILIRYRTTSFENSLKTDFEFPAPARHKVSGAEYYQNNYYFALGKKVYCLDANGNRITENETPELEGDIYGIEIFNNRLFIALANKVLVYEFTTLVNNVLQYRYTIEVSTTSSVQTENTYRYTILNWADTTRTYLYKILDTVDNITRYRYGIQDWVGISLIYRYVIGRQVDNNRTYRYTILNWADSIRQYRYNIFNQVNNVIRYRYNIFKWADQSFTYRYNISSYVNNILQYRYTIGGVVDNIIKYEYKIHKFVDSVLAYRYTVLNRVRNILRYRYSITSAISNILRYQYSLSSYADNILSYRYNLYEAVFNNVSYSYVVGKLLVDNVISYRYKLSGFVNNIISYRYIVHKYIDNIITYRYGISELVNNIIAYRYNISSFVNSTRRYRYRITNFVNSITSYRYAISGFVDNILSYLYRIGKRSKSTEIPLILVNHNQEINLELINNREQTLRLINK